MAVLVTRPPPDNAATAAALQERGVEAVLAPMLRFETVSFEDEADAAYVGVIATSANALRAITDHPIRARLTALPLFTVGEHTAGVARDLGFRDIVVGVKPDQRGAMGLPALIEARLGGRRGGRARATRAEREETLLYLAGADITRELTGALGDRGYSLITHTTYRMVPVKGLPAPARDAFAADRLRAILHYSRRSAQAFIAAARADGVEISALALPQCCLSDAVAQVMRDAGAARVVVARAPDDASMIEAVLRATQT